MNRRSLTSSWSDNMRKHDHNIIFFESSKAAIQVIKIFKRVVN